MITAAEIRAASILIVDDKEANVTVLEEMLHGAGYTAVSSTRDSLQVCELHRKHRYDLIILDLLMPVMDGFEVMEHLKGMEAGGYISVLVVTAEPAHKQRALTAGARDFVSKPFDLTEVLARVRGLIELRLLYKVGTDLNVERLENAQRIAGLGDWEYDFTKNHRLRWSDGVYRILGISRADTKPSAEAFYLRVHADDLARVRREKQIVDKGTRRVEFEHRIVRLDGEIRHIRQVAEMRFDDHGEPTIEAGTIQDITERKATEEALRGSEERYRKMLTHSPDALFVHVDGLLTFVNPAFCQMMGASEPGMLIGQPAADVIDPGNDGKVMERGRKAISYRSSELFETKFARLNGSIVDVEATSISFDFLGHTEVQVTARDISARKKAESVLRDSEERFKFVARAVSDVVWDWNLLTNVVWWNDGFLTTFGFRAGEIEPSIASWTARIHPDDRGRVVEGMRGAINGTQETWTSEYRFERKDGTYAFVHDRGYILRDAAGLGTRMVGGMRDLTDRKKMEEQNLRSQRMESIGTLAGGIAHDLNNVLAPIMMAIELLKTGGVAEERRMMILETIDASCRRGAELVRQVLSFARGVDHRRVAINLRSLLEEVMAVIKQTFPRNIRIAARIPEGLWPVNGDPSQLHQVLLNLTVNARDSMPHGGKLTLTASNLTVDAQFAATSQEAKTGTYVLLQVADTGCGIPPEAKERIFEPFFTTKEVGQGTGLGLATVHTVVKSHGGFLTLDSEVGEGTTFKIYLPADQALRTADTMPPFACKLPHGRDELLLVIDDESSVLEITKQTLQAFGYRVLTALNGAEGAALYAKQAAEIALVITDMMMPIMDGVATIHVLACINPSVKVIAASGLELTENNAKASSAGVQDFLQKPFTAETLLRRVREVIDRAPVIPIGAGSTPSLAPAGAGGPGPR